MSPPARRPAPIVLGQLGRLGPGVARDKRQQSQPMHGQRAHQGCPRQQQRVDMIGAAQVRFMRRLHLLRASPPRSAPPSASMLLHRHASCQHAAIPVRHAHLVVAPEDRRRRDHASWRAPALPPSDLRRGTVGDPHRRRPIASIDTPGAGDALTAIVPRASISPAVAIRRHGLPALDQLAIEPARAPAAEHLHARPAAPPHPASPIAHAQPVAAPRRLAHLRIAMRRARPTPSAAPPPAMPAP